MYCVCAYALLDDGGFCSLCDRPVESAVTAAYRRGMRVGSAIVLFVRLFVIAVSVALAVWSFKSGLHSHYPLAVETATIGLIFWLFGLSDSIVELSAV